MLTKKTWTEFRSTGLLVFLNTFLHIFGWAIVVEFDEDGNETVYPARTTFRGFSEETQTKAYKKISEYMNINSETLLNEIETDDEGVF